MAAVRHLGFSKVPNFTSVPFGEPLCITMPNFTQIGQAVADICPFFDVSDGGRPKLCKSWFESVQ